MFSAISLLLYSKLLRSLSYYKKYPAAMFLGADMFAFSLVSVKYFTDRSISLSKLNIEATLPHR